MCIELSVQQYTKVELLGPLYEEIEVDLKVITDLSASKSLIGEIISKFKFFVINVFNVC